MECVCGGVCVGGGARGVQHKAPRLRTYSCKRRSAGGAPTVRLVAEGGGMRRREGRQHLGTFLGRWDQIVEIRIRVESSGSGFVVFHGLHRLALCRGGSGWRHATLSSVRLVARKCR
eukprot:351427-Chlamydomonas_euryale.AAC.3